MLGWSFEHGNELAGDTKFEEFLDQVTTCALLNSDSDP